MQTKNRIYMAIDLKSFYASVECVERNLDPLTTNLVVADTSKTEKTICLAVSPSLKPVSYTHLVDYIVAVIMEWIKRELQRKESGKYV